MWEYSIWSIQLSHWNGWLKLGLMNLTSWFYILTILTEEIWLLWKILGELVVYSYWIRRRKFQRSDFLMTKLVPIRDMVWSSTAIFFSIFGTFKKFIWFNLGLYTKPDDPNTCRRWNPPGSGILYEDWDFPIFFVSNETQGRKVVQVILLF